MKNLANNRKNTFFSGILANLSLSLTGEVFFCLLLGEYHVRVPYRRFFVIFLPIPFLRALIGSSSLFPFLICLPGNGPEVPWLADPV